ncbi:MAG: hypothetical protein ACKV19_24315 [Verrucomicrobiales bacterium]
MSSSQPIAAPPSSVLADFGDWLSPMVVKELRQGLKTRAFVSALIILHGVLTLLLLFAISEGNLVGFTKMFWWICGGLLIFALPLSGFNALVGEVKGRTFDLLSLTRLGPLGIVAGKWLALIAQSGLIAISILPYVVLSYFGGGVDLPGEVTLLLFLWLFSAVVSAFAIMVSAMPSVIVRALFFLSAWIWVKPVLDEILTLSGTDVRYGNASFRWFIDSATGQRVPLLILIGIVVPLWSYLCYTLLELGATAIAPVATNHATRKRPLALVAMAVALNGIYFFPPDSDARATSLVCLLGVASLAAIDGLTEPPAITPSLLAPFHRRGRLGRWLAWFLAPGWPTGLLYGVILAVLVTVGFAQFPYYYTTRRLETNLLVLGKAAQFLFCKSGDQVWGG